MTHIKFVYILILLPFIGHTQSQTNSGSDTIQNKFKTEIQAFSEASDFFFYTLSENFKGTRGENVYALMKVISKELEEPEDFFRLHVNADKFNVLNTSLKVIYNYFFPIHVYEKGSELKNYVVENRIENKICDTIIVVMPTKMTCPIPRNTFIEGSFKDSFREQLLNDKTPSVVKKEIMGYLDRITSHFSALSFSIDSLRKYNTDELNNIYDSDYDRILVSLIFWEYLSHCANYDLNTRKYFYEG